MAIINSPSGRDLAQLSVISQLGISIATILAIGTFSVALSQDQANTLRADEIASLVNKLRGDDLPERSKAQKALLDLGEEALPFLEQTFSSMDKTFNKRSRELHRDITMAFVAKQAPFGIDVLIMRLLAKKGKLSENDWGTIYLVRQAIIHYAESKGQFEPGEWHFETRPPNFGSLPVSTIKKVSDDYQVNRKRLLANSVRLNGDLTNVLLMSNNTVSATDIVDTTVLGSGNVHARLTCTGSLIFCNGPFDSLLVDGSIIIAKGKVTIKEHVANSVVLSGEKIHFDGIAKNTWAYSVGEISGPRVAGNSKLRSHQAAILDSLFLTAATLGLDLMFTNDGAKVINVAKGSFCDRAGLRQADIIVSVNGIAIDSARSLCTLLKSSIASSMGTLRVTRQGNAVDIVLFP